MKCTNLAPKFLKLNKHYNRGTRLVDKVNTWLMYTFTRHVGAWNWYFMSTNTHHNMGVGGLKTSEDGTCPVLMSG
jgi:hypothetical protein